MPDPIRTLRLLRTSAQDLAREVNQLPPEAAAWKPAPDEWSVHETLSHLRDVERVIFLPRIRRVIEEARPFLPVVDEVRYHTEHWNPDEPLSSLLADFLADRAAECESLARASDWSRLGVHETRGPVSLAWLADYALGHTWEHLSQIMRVRLAHELKGSRSAEGVRE